VAIANIEMLQRGDAMRVMRLRGIPLFGPPSWSMQWVKQK